MLYSIYHLRDSRNRGGKTLKTHDSESRTTDCLETIFLVSQLVAASHTGLKHGNTLLKGSDKELRSPALLEGQSTYRRPSNNTHIALRPWPMGLIIINRLSEAYERDDGMPRERSSSDSHDLMP
jgi:hypothetical protein